MYNKSVIVGHLTRDPEIKYSSKGLAICKINIASNQRIGKKKETLFIDAVAFGKTAENINKFFKKGSPILIEGRLVFLVWKNKEGNLRNKHEIHIEKFSFINKKEQKKSTNENHSSEDYSDNNKTLVSENNEDIPF